MVGQKKVHRRNKGEPATRYRELLLPERQNLRRRVVHGQAARFRHNRVALGLEVRGDVQDGSQMGCRKLPAIRIQGQRGVARLGTRWPSLDHLLKRALLQRFNQLRF